MNREIKFRAWNKELKHMVFPTLEFGRTLYPVFYKANLDDDGKIVLEMVSVDFILQDNEFIPMQYIGLKDRNGVEIYEGDNYQVANNHIYSVEYKTESECNYEISYACYVLVREDGLTIPFDEYAIKNGEVIGNIYEKGETK